MDITAVKVQRLYLQVADQLSKQITGGSLSSGDRLPSERDLAARFQVSRPTIREAMIALEVSDLVEVRSGSGVYVKARNAAKRPQLLEDDSPGPIEILEARLHFEAQAAYLAASRMGEDDLSQLNELLKRLQKENLDEKGTEQADRQFHLLIAKASQNSAIHSTIAWLWQLRDESTLSQFFHEKLRKSGIKPVIAAHQEIVDAITAKKPEQARDAMSSHLEQVIAMVLSDTDQE